MPKKGQTSKRSREVSQADLTASEKGVDDKIKEPSTSSSSDQAQTQEKEADTETGMKEEKAAEEQKQQQPEQEKEQEQEQEQPSTMQEYGEMLNRLKEIQTLREKKQALTRELFTQDPDMNRETWKRTVKKELGVDPALFDPAEESTLKQRIVEMMDQEDKEKSESIENELKDKVASMNGGGLSDKDEDLQACKKALHMAGGKEALLQQDEVIEAMKPISEQLKAKVEALTEKMTLHPDFAKPDPEDLKEIKAKELEIAKYRQQLESEMKGESRASSSSSSGDEPALKKTKTSESDTQPDIQNSAPEVTATGAETA